MTQWINENTRFKGNEEPSRLNQLLTKELEVIRKDNYHCPGKSDHVLIEFKVNNSVIEGRREEHKNGRYNYGKANCRIENIFHRDRLEQFSCNKEHSEEMGRVHLNIHRGHRQICPKNGYQRKEKE